MTAFNTKGRYELFEMQDASYDRILYRGLVVVTNIGGRGALVHKPTLLVPKAADDDDQNPKTRTELFEESKSVLDSFFTSYKALRNRSTALNISTV
jgi:hypothetical protein